MQTVEKTPKVETQERVEQRVDDGNKIDLNAVDEAVDIVQQVIKRLTIR
jgi:hypothetical protein